MFVLSSLLDRLQISKVKSRRTWPSPNSLCGSGGAAVAGKPDAQPIFAQKAAGRGLPLAKFVMGYYSEAGVGQPKP